jgi:hypothetical protein
MGFHEIIENKLTTRASNDRKLANPEMVIVITY